MPIAQIDGTSLFYEETGRGEPLLLVHGSWVDHTTWDAVVPGLNSSFRVVTCDLRGHGQSRLDPPDGGNVHDDVDDLFALIADLDLGPVNVVGNSSGACIALRLASEHPAQVRRALAHEPPCIGYLADDPENKPLLDAFGETIGAVMQQIGAGDHRGAAERFFDDIVGEPWASLPIAMQDMIAAHAVAFGGQMQDPDAIALDPEAMRSVTCPTLLSEGGQSPRPLILAVDELAKVLPAAQRRVIAESGHIPHVTHPDAYVDTILDFIGST
jgi:pimeloyl-ACP methyl ester carboxylesterase